MSNATYSAGISADSRRMRDSAVARDHDLAVERRRRRQQLAERPQLGEVAEQRPLVARPQRQLSTDVLEHPAEPVPLRLVLPAVRLRQLADELRFHRRKRDHSVQVGSLLTLGHVSSSNLDEPPGTAASL
jgi:hypothetical protein